MITRKFEGGECHVFNVLLFASIVFPCLYDFEVAFWEQNKIFRVDVSSLALFRAFAGLVQLWLQVSSCIIGGIVFRIRDISPT